LKKYDAALLLEDAKVYIYARTFLNLISIEKEEKLSSKG
jgi:hypothetical protein